MKCIITCYSLPTCFSRCRNHYQGNLQVYKKSKQTVKMHKRTTYCYRACLKLPTISLNVSLLNTNI